MPSESRAALWCQALQRTSCLQSLFPEPGPPCQGDPAQALETIILRSAWTLSGWLQLTLVKTIINFAFDERFKEPTLQGRHQICILFRSRDFTSSCGLAWWGWHLIGQTEGSAQSYLRRPPTCPWGQWHLLTKGGPSVSPL